ncbi:MAG: CHAT domain-containing protein [Spirulinaceae cyanobacterium]
MNATKKQVILRFGHGSFEQGFDVNLRITTAAKTLVDLDGFLPENLDILRAHQKLLRSYQDQFIGNYNGYYRGFRVLEAISTETTHISVRDSADELMDQFNLLLEQSLAFKPFREALFYHLNSSDSIRFVIRTFDPILQWLPWHLCNLFQIYPHSGVTLSWPSQGPLVNFQNLKAKVRVLPILGDSTNIDIQADLIVLRDQLPASAEILDAQIATSLAAIGDALWQQSPDILFFAGHSSSRGEQGIFCINEQETVTINELKFALKRAIDKGLKLAIFNSCDGLKLAQDLADLNLPAIIVMRERIPDEAAQKFLEYFLAAFANETSPKPLTQAVREAQERLQHYEQKFPCVSWLPVLFQQPEAADLTWQDLRVRETPPANNSTQPSKIPISSRFPNRIQRYKWPILGTFSLSFLLLFFVVRPILASYFVAWSGNCYDKESHLCAQKFAELAAMLDPSKKNNLDYYRNLYSGIKPNDDLPRNPIECNNNATLLIEHGDYSQAINSLYLCEDMVTEEDTNPNDIDLLHYKINKNLAWAMYEQESFSDAKFHVRKSLQYQPYGVESHCLSALLEDIDNPGILESLEYCRKGIKKQHPEERLWLRQAELRLSNLD